MAIAFVQETGNATASSATTLTIAVTNATTAGNALILSFAAYTKSPTVTQVTDTVGNTWILHQSASNVRAVLGYTRQDVGPLSTSDSITVTVSASSHLVGVVHEFSGLVSTANAIDQHSKGNYNLTTTRSAGTTGTTTQADELVFACFSTGGSPAPDTSFTAGSGYTSPSPNLYSVLGAVTVDFEYQIVSATGTFSPTGTGNSNTSIGGDGVAVTFKAGGVTKDITVSTTGTSTPAFTVYANLVPITVSTTGTSTPAFTVTGVTQHITLSTTGTSTPAFTVTTTKAAAAGGSLLLLHVG